MRTDKVHTAVILTHHDCHTKERHACVAIDF